MDDDAPPSSGDDPPSSGGDPPPGGRPAADDGVTVRRYRPGETNAVWSVHERAFRAAPVDHDPELNRYLRRIPGFYLDSGGEFLVATAPADPADPPAYPPEDELIVGAGGFLPSTAPESSVRPGAPVAADGDTAEVRSVRVDPDFQRRGVGRAVMRELEARARDRGFRRVVLDTGSELAAAQSLYESLGYERAGREAFRGYDLVYYEKRIANPE